MCLSFKKLVFEWFHREGACIAILREKKRKERKHFKPASCSMRWGLPVLNTALFLVFHLKAKLTAIELQQ